MMVVTGITTTTEPLEMVNDDRRFGISVLISGVVPFVVREWPGRRHNLALCYSSTEPSPNDEDKCFIEPVPEFTHFNPISPTGWGAHIDTPTLPSPTTSKPIQDPNQPGRGETDYSDPGFDVSDSDDEVATLPIQCGLTNRDDQVQLNLFNLPELSDEAFTLASEGRQEGSDYPSQVRLVAAKLRESTPPMT
jgi:hypothetical protein